MSTKLDDLLAEAQRLAALTRHQVALVLEETARSNEPGALSASGEAADLEAIRHMREKLTGGNVIPFPLDRSLLAWNRRGPLQRLSATVLPFVRNTAGVTSIEYSVLAAGIGLAVIAIVSSLGGTLGASFQTIAAYLGG
ncbi:Flp family type IVb pilin [Bradyrhizobium elkanii]